MRLQHHSSGDSIMSCGDTLPLCPHCGDLLVAPEASEWVDGDEIRHHWACESCGGSSCTSIELTSH